MVWQSRWVKAANGQVGFCVDMLGSRGGDGRGKLWSVVLRCADAGLGSQGRFWSVLLRMGKFRQSRRVMVRQALDWRGKSR